MPHLIFTKREAAARGYFWKPAHEAPMQKIGKGFFFFRKTPADSVRSKTVRASGVLLSPAPCKKATWLVSVGPRRDSLGTLLRGSKSTRAGMRKCPAGSKSKSTIRSRRRRLPRRWKLEGLAEEGRGRRAETGQGEEGVGKRARRRRRELGGPSAGGEGGRGG